MKLGYTPEQTSEIVSHIDRRDGGRRSALQGGHLPVFDCRWRPPAAVRFPDRSRLKMMAAAQPFLSGAISKTINMPEESTVDDIMNAYIESGWG